LWEISSFSIPHPSTRLAFDKDGSSDFSAGRSGLSPE
jgi:hypothetical protein